MVAYNSFAVLGAGSLGSFVVNELLKFKVSVKVLTRDDSKPAFATFKKNGATIVKVDYSKESELQKALSDVEVVVSVVSQSALAAQNEIAKIAKAAGVQLFVPAEYGIYVTEGFTHHKKVVHDTLKELDLPYTVFYTGFFAEYHGFIGFDYANARIRVVGSGDVPFSVTARPDIARFAKIPIEGDRKTHHEVAVIAEKFGKKFELEYVDLDENRKNFNTDFVAFFTTVLADGNAVSGPAEAVEAAIQKFFPEWNPSPIDEFITA